jgi:hypothetical protein
MLHNVVALVLVTDRDVLKGRGADKQLGYYARC